MEIDAVGRCWKCDNLHVRRQQLSIAYSTFQNQQPDYVPWPFDYLAMYHATSCLTDDYALPHGLIRSCLSCSSWQPIYQLPTTSQMPLSSRTTTPISLNTRGLTLWQLFALLSDIQWAVQQFSGSGFPLRRLNGKLLSSRVIEGDHSYPNSNTCNFVHFTWSYFFWHKIKART